MRREHETGWRQATTSVGESGETTTAPTYVANITPVISEADAATLTPPAARVSASHSLHVRGLTVKRHAQTRHREDKHYRVDDVYTVSQSLCDSAAGPSIVTTGLLALLPADAVVERSRDNTSYPLLGADGKELRQSGSMVLIFRLGDTPCRHRFRLVEGKPLLLLGTDFLDPRRAVISMNEDGAGHGTLALTSLAPDGRTPVEHSVEVSTLHPSQETGRAGGVNSVSPGEDDNTGSTTRDATGVVETDTAETFYRLDPLPTATPPGLGPQETVKEALASGAWLLEHAEHLLYSQRPLH